MKTWRLFGPLILPYWWRMALALLVSILGSLTDLLRPWPLKIIVDNVVSSKQHHHQQFVESLLTALAGHDRTWLLVASVALVFLVAADAGRHGRDHGHHGLAVRPPGPQSHTPPVRHRRPLHTPHQAGLPPGTAQGRRSHGRGPGDLRGHAAGPGVYA